MTTTAHDEEFAELLAAAVKEATHRPDAEQSGTNAMNDALRAARAPRQPVFGRLPEEQPTPTEGWSSADGGARGTSTPSEPDMNAALRDAIGWKRHGIPPQAWQHD